MANASRNTHGTLFIVPTFGQFDYARACVESIVRYTPPGSYAVAIVDDASQDWDTPSLMKWPACPKFIERFLVRGGLTRSWNAGLALARDYGFEYAVCGNSDLLVTEGWWEPLRQALDTHDLVGPISNAPGHAPWQNVTTYSTFMPTDDREYLNTVARTVRGFTKPAIDCQFINGFCMAARTSTWWDGAFDDWNVFDPRCPLTGNEDELQNRWRMRQRRIGFVPRSFVFHYRSVSRPEALTSHASRGAYRKVEGTSGDDRVHAEEHGQLVDESLAAVGEVQRREIGGCAQL